MSKMKIIFPKREMANEALTNVTSSLAAGGSGVGTALLLNADFLQKDKDGKATSYGKYVGFGASVIGTALNCVFAEKHIRGAAYGMVAAGAIHATGNAIMPDHKAKLGLGDVGAPASSNDDTYAEMIRKSLKAADESKTEYRTAADESVNGFGTVSDDPMMAIV
jgi:hypothetical protein